MSSACEKLIECNLNPKSAFNAAATEPTPAPKNIAELAEKMKNEIITKDFTALGDQNGNSEGKKTRTLSDTLKQEIINKLDELGESKTAKDTARILKEMEILTDGTSKASNNLIRNTDAWADIKRELGVSEVVIQQEKSARVTAAQQIAWDHNS